MIRVERLKQYLRDKARIGLDQISVHTTDYRVLTMELKTINGQPELRLTKTYTALLYILDVHKRRNLTTVALYLRKFFQEFGYPEERYQVHTDDELIEDNCVIQLECQIHEETRLIEVLSEEERRRLHHDLISYEGAFYLEEEVLLRKGI